MTPGIATSLRRQQKALIKIADQVNRQPNIDPLAFFPQLLETIAQTLGIEKAGLHLYDDERQQLHLVEQIGRQARENWQVVNLENNLSPLSLALRMVSTQFGYQGGLGKIMAVPIMGVQLCLGTVSVGLPEEDIAQEILADWESFLLGMGYLLGIAMEHTGLINDLLHNIDKLQEMQRNEAERARRLEDQNKFLESTNTSLQNLVITDPLTGLYNRRHIMEVLDQEIGRSERTGLSFCLCMLDLDNFKSINDELGHPVGDQALVMLAGWLKQNIRQLDVVGRYGGEEFILLLVNCQLAAGITVADKLRQIVGTESVTGPFAARGGFRLSAGVAQFQVGMSASDLTTLADQALYQAKAAGRDQVKAAPLNPSLPPY